MQNQYNNEYKTEEESIPQEVKTNNFIVPLAIVVSGLLIAVAIFFSGSSRNLSSVLTSTGKQAQSDQTADIGKVNISNVNIEGRPFIGNPNAQITIAYWYDYQCPFCKRTEQTVMPQLINDYVKTGKVRIVYKDFQFLGEDSQTAGLADHAVWEISPDKFYEWHKAMYEKQDGENSGWGNKTDILALTQSLGIDSVKVGELMTIKAAEYQKIMDADKAEGIAFGINGTPGTIIGTQLIRGAQPYSVFKQVIELTLQKK